MSDLREITAADIGRDESHPYTDVGAQFDDVGEQFIAPIVSNPGHDETRSDGDAARTEHPQSAQRVIAVILLIAIVVGAVYFYLLTPSGDSGGDVVVATVNGAPIRQSDVDVQVNLGKAINETVGADPSAVNAADVLSNMVFQRLAMQDISKHNFPLASDADVASYLASAAAASNATTASFTPYLTKYGIASNVFSDSLRVRLTIQNYKNQLVADPGLTTDQRDALINNWVSGLYDPKIAAIAYPNKLRDDSGPAPREGHLAPDIAGIDLNSGKPVTLGQLRGQPVMINFWATWCGPCRDEMPNIVSAYSAYHASKGLVVLAVDTEDGGAKDKALAFVNQFKMTFPVVQDDSNNSISLEYNIIATPSTFFVDRNGMIQSVHLGSMDESTLQTNLSKILQ